MDIMVMNKVQDEGSNVKAFADSTVDASLSWKDIGWLRSITKLPILIKGVLTHEDDYTPATIAVLEEVVHAVKGKVPVFIDGGVRRGTDVFKALALGAEAVLIGRPVVYGLAAKGETGVKRVIEMLKDELELTMTLSGCPTIKDITRGHVITNCERLHSSL
ncbi:hypothetical protein NL676_028429 [Syzygium grande]|nr:hypothetical protein NL676_028429 [Syzygium grande]